MARAREIEEEKESERKRKREREGKNESERERKEARNLKRVTLCVVQKVTQASEEHSCDTASFFLQILKL